MQFFTFIKGLPKPAGSKTGFAIRKAGIFTGKVAVVDACKSSAGWKKYVRVESANTVRKLPNEQQMRFPAAGLPIEFACMFVLPRPKCHFRTGAFAGDIKATAPRHHIIKPDVLKLTRAIEDALTGVVYKDDCQITDEHISKRYAAAGEDSGVYITARIAGEAQHLKD